MILHTHIPSYSCPKPWVVSGTELHYMHVKLFHATPRPSSTHFTQPSSLDLAHRQQLETGRTAALLSATPAHPENLNELSTRSAGQNTYGVTWGKIIPYHTKHQEKAPSKNVCQGC